MIAREKAKQWLPDGILMDPYFPDEAQCSEEHARHMLEVIWPTFTACSTFIVAQSPIKTYAIMGAFTVGDRSPKRLGAGHVLFLDDIGKGKTLLAEIIARLLGGNFARFQGTPDKMPADFTGNYIIDIDNDGKRYFKLVKGPAFGDIVLIDEITRTTARTQSAMLEALAEGTVTLGDKKHNIGASFIMATANPQESEGTFAPSEALLDRFTFEVRGDDFTAQDYVGILRATQQFGSVELKPVCDHKRVCEIRMFFHETVAVSDEIRNRIGKFLESAYNPHKFGYLKNLVLQFGNSVIHSGISGRGSIHLEGAAKTLAAFRYRDYVVPDDVLKVLLPVLRHRIIFNRSALNFFRAEWGQKTILDTTDEIIKQLIREAW